jgi:hypothetical protein
VQPRGPSSVIARTAGDSWEGRHHACEGDPSGLGLALLDLAQPAGPFGGDLEKLLTVLLDEHPAGWVTIVHVDWSQRPGHTHLDHRAPDSRTERPQCLCQGDRCDEPRPLIRSHGEGWGTAWAYAINARTAKMFVYERIWEDMGGSAQLVAAPPGARSACVWRGLPAADRSWLRCARGLTLRAGRRSPKLSDATQGGLATAFTRPPPPPARSSKRKYYRDEGFIETTFEVNEADLSAIFEGYSREDADIDFNEVEVTNNRPMKVWLYVTGGAHVDPDDADADSIGLEPAASHAA